MRRRIVDFSQDEAGDWIADLSCLHRQHLRHRPPFDQRAWVLDEVQRRARIGTEIDCPLCDRAELPPGLRVVRTAGPFDAQSLPPGLRRSHRIGARTWGRLRVLAGTVNLDLDLSPARHLSLATGAAQPIPPEVPHLVSVAQDAVIAIEFLARDDQSTALSAG